MRILYGITKSNFGGAQRYVFDLATEAKSQGHQVAVIIGGSGVLISKLQAQDIETFPIKGLSRDISPFDDIRAGFFIMEIIARFKPDIFHINSSKMGGIGGLAGRIMGVKKIIFTSHGWAFNETWRPIWQRIIIRFICWITIMLAHKTICVSEKTRRDVEKFPFAPGKLPVVLNGIKEFELMPRAEAREKLVPGIPPETLLVGTTSELHKVKGLNILLESWSELIKGRRALLILIGDGEERDNLQNMAQQMGITDSVIFKGFLDNARSYLSGLDIFVMPSLSENLPYSILEAGVARLPVVATAVGGIPEVIESGRNSVLVLKEDPVSLLSALTKLADDRELAKQLGEALHTTVKGKFSLEQMVEKTLEIYK